MEELRVELREQKHIVKEQKKEIEKLKIQNSGLLQKLKTYETQASFSSSDSDVEIIEIEIEPERSFSKQEISRFRQLNLRSGVELENIPVHDLDTFVATVTEKSNQTRVKLPKPPKLKKQRKRKKRSLRFALGDSDVTSNNNSSDDLEYYTTHCNTDRSEEILRYRDKSASSQNLRKLIDAGKHLKSKIKVGAKLPDGVELV